MLSNFLAQSPNGSLLITTREQGAASLLTGNHRDIIRVEPMVESDALTLLNRKLGATHNMLEGLELIRALECMPLAITQAATYICRRAPRMSLIKYIEQLNKTEKSTASILDYDSGDLRRDPSASNSIIATWQISFEHIRAIRPSATHLLSFMSLFDRQGIPESLLRPFTTGEESGKGDTEGPGVGDSGAESQWSDTRDLEEDVTTLRDFSLITADASGTSFEMHRLVQLSTRQWLKAQGHLELYKQVCLVKIRGALVNGKYMDPKHWSYCQTLYPHAEAAMAYQPLAEGVLASWSIVMHFAGSFATAKGSYNTAEIMLRGALDASTVSLGENDGTTLAARHQLLTVLGCQRKYDEAEELSHRALKAYEKDFGSEDPRTLDMMEIRSVLLKLQKDANQAADIALQVYEIRKRVNGPEHPDTLRTGQLLTSIISLVPGSAQVVEEKCKQYLDKIEDAMGRNHPETLLAQNRMAHALAANGKYSEAEAMLRNFLQDIERVIGKDHPIFFTALTAVAEMISRQGRYQEASPLYEAGVAGLVKVVGADHPTVQDISKVHASFLDRRDDSTTE